MTISLASLIREARDRQGNMTQGDLGNLAGTSLENITSIENGRNLQPKPDIIAGMARALDLSIVDIYAAITGTLNNFPWDRVGELDLKDTELELMFKQVDSMLAGEAKDRVKAFIRFTIDEERRKLRREAEDKRRNNSKNVDDQIPAIFKNITITETTRQAMRKELSAFFAEEVEGNGQLKANEARLAKLERMGKNLQRLYVEEEISLADFKEHRAQLEAERSRLRTTVDGVRQNQHLIKADFEVALELATQLDFLYNNGNFDQRRLLCETVLKRIYVEDGRITKTEFNAPFAIIARANGSGTVPSGGAEETISRTENVSCLELLGCKGKV